MKYCGGIQQNVVLMCYPSRMYRQAVWKGKGVGGQEMKGQGMGYSQSHLTS